MKKNMDNSVIGENIKKNREIQKITQKELSERCDMTETHLSNIENNKVNLSTKAFIKAANSLGVSMEELINGTRENNSKVKKVEKEIEEKDQEILLYSLKCIKQIKDTINEYNKKKEYVSDEVNLSMVGDNIESYRIDKKISRSLLAKRAGIDEKVYKNIESNNGSGSLQKYIDISNSLETPVDCFFENILNNKSEIIGYYINEVFDSSDIKKQEMMIKLVNEISEIIKRWSK